MNTNNVNAGEMMEMFWRTGYPELRQQEDIKTKATEKLEQLLYHRSENPIVYGDLGYAVSFKPKHTYNTDWESLNRFLMEVGIYPLVADLKQDTPDKFPEICKMFELPKKDILSFSVNKVGKQLLSHSIALPSNEYELLKIIKQSDSIIVPLSEMYRNLKVKMQNCPTLLEERKISHKYGSVYLKKDKVRYDIETMLNVIGTDFFIKHGKPNSKKLYAFIKRGIIKNEQIEQFRTITNSKVRLEVNRIDNKTRVTSKQMVI
ncbi:hypothetical protein M3202_19735 [Alkalihalobacillus oceani]|uniref:Uncharacterized protein n=1 Tax=Halalkalibacter oceani TaxID=1653776 RepID=A0A9X2DSS6_9BACI|nr:hypothetical protein [Halalkalibacter oceani]MCM3716279.1 hypothetical protein [Halalkalibacter oceani]